MNPLHALIWLAVLSPIDTRPPLADVERFPTSKQCWDAYEFRCKHKEWLYKFSTYYPVRNEYADWLDELEACGDVWEAVWRARGALQRDGSGGVTNTGYIRDRLAELREMMGDDAYYTARMPPVVPIWRFREIEW